MRSGVLDALIEALAGATTVCRGPKPAVVLRRHGIPVHVNARSPHTTAELLEALPEALVRGRGVALLHDGGGNPVLVDALRARGAGSTSCTPTSGGSRTTSSRSRS